MPPSAPGSRIKAKGPLPSTVTSKKITPWSTRSGTVTVASSSARARPLTSSEGTSSRARVRNMGRRSLRPLEYEDVGRPHPRPAYGQRQSLEVGRERVLLGVHGLAAHPVGYRQPVVVDPPGGIGRPRGRVGAEVRVVLAVEAQPLGLVRGGGEDGES